MNYTNGYKTIRNYNVNRPFTPKKDSKCQSCFEGSPRNYVVLVKEMDKQNEKKVVFVLDQKY